VNRTIDATGARTSGARLVQLAKPGRQALNWGLECNRDVTSVNERYSSGRASAPPRVPQADTLAVSIGERPLEEFRAYWRGHLLSVMARMELTEAHYILYWK